MSLHSGTGLGSLLLILLFYSAIISYLLQQRYVLFHFGVNCYFKITVMYNELQPSVSPSGEIIDGGYDLNSKDGLVSYVFCDQSADFIVIASM
jgi:hypothetical protein